MALRARQIDPGIRLPARVAGNISKDIISGRLKPGDKLPTEPELAELFGVSRTVVREAIARLRSEGIVRSKQGAGVFVADARQQPTLRIDQELLADKALFRNLFELRAMLEINTAGMAAERRDEKALRALEAALEHLHQVPGATTASVDADLDFHHAIALATGNTFIAAFIRFISFQIRESIITTRQNRDPQRSATVTYREHAAILNAIRKGNTAAARRAMSNHIANAAKRLGIA